MKKINQFLIALVVASLSMFSSCNQRDFSDYEGYQLDLVLQDRIMYAATNQVVFHKYRVRLKDADGNQVTGSDLNNLRVIFAPQGDGGVNWRREAGEFNKRITDRHFVGDEVLMYWKSGSFLGTQRMTVTLGLHEGTEGAIATPIPVVDPKDFNIEVITENILSLSQVDANKYGKSTIQVMAYGYDDIKQIWTVDQPVWNPDGQAQCITTACGYKLYAFDQALNSCPDGFRLPTPFEWGQISEMGINTQSTQVAVPTAFAQQPFFFDDIPPYYKYKDESGNIQASGFGQLRFWAGPSYQYQGSNTAEFNNVGTLNTSPQYISNTQEQYYCVKCVKTLE